MKRSEGRAEDQIRSLKFITSYSKYAEGSVLVQFGDTHVLCNVTVEDRLPGWLRRSAVPHGWLTAEYALLPRSTQRRVQRENRWPKGRTQEISRLIGRSLRMAVDLYALGERQLIVDCDVLQADGGTRTAAVTGAWVAVQQALQGLVKRGEVPVYVVREQIAAVSVGLVDGLPLLDLAYGEDVSAEVDLNVVMTAEGEIVEVQGTAEKQPVSRQQFDTLLDLAAAGIKQIVTAQAEAFASLSR
jgi:ribonuclease PH